VATIAGADMSDRVGNKADEGALQPVRLPAVRVGGLTGLLVGLGAFSNSWHRSVMLCYCYSIYGSFWRAIGAAAGGLLGASWFGNSGQS